MVNWRLIALQKADLLTAAMYAKLLSMEQY